MAHAHGQGLSIVHSLTRLAVGALASLDAIAVSDEKIDGTRLEGFRVMKTEYFMNAEGGTVDQGPVLIGVAPNLNAQEIEEAIEADPQQRVDIPATEQVMRPVFPLEIIGRALVEARASSLETMKGVFNLKWSIPEGQGLVWFAYNLDLGALTSGLILTIYAKHYGVWLKD